MNERGRGIMEAKKERKKSGLRIISRKELWARLLAHGTDWWEVFSKL